jgi:hypothetical protein
MPGERQLRPSHRALRLIMTACAVAAGLCLVIGLVTLVATIGTAKPGPASTSTAGGHRPTGMVGPTPLPSAGQSTANQGRTGHHGHHAWLSPGGRGLASGKVLASYSGHGTAETALFTIGKPGIWHLTWSYNCRNGQISDFVLGETRTWIGLAVTVDLKGTSDHGSYWVMNDGGPHSMVVVSSCAWHLQVARLARPA